MYVLKQANRRLTAGTDLIVRLHRGEVPAPVRRGDGWAGYLQTHPAGDYRLAAMQSTLEDIRMGATVPLTKKEALENIRAQNQLNRQAACAAVKQKYPNCDWLHGGLIDWNGWDDCPSGWSSEAATCKDN